MVNTIIGRVPLFAHPANYDHYVLYWYKSYKTIRRRAHNLIFTLHSVLRTGVCCQLPPKHASPACGYLTQALPARHPPQGITSESLYFAVFESSPIATVEPKGKQKEIPSVTYSVMSCVANVSSSLVTGSSPE